MSRATWTQKQWMKRSELILPIHRTSTLFKFMIEFISKRLHSDCGTYSIIGLYSLFGPTGMAKSERIFNRLELFPPPFKLLVLCPMSFVIEVCVGCMGNKVEARTIEAIGLQVAMLDVSWIDCTKSLSPVVSEVGAS